MFGKGSWQRKILVAGSCVGLLVVGGGYTTYQRRLRENRSITADDFNAQQNQQQLQWAYAHLKNPQGHFQAKLFRYTTCPWCGTVKSFMDYHKIPHQCVEVEPMLKAEISKSGYKKVPQLRFDTLDTEGPYLVDSKIIVDTLAEKLGYSKQLTDPEVSKWRDWARGPLVRLITLEFNSSLVAAWRGYSYIDGCDSIPYANKLFLKLVGAPVMYLVAMNITKPKLIKDGYLTAGDAPQQRLHEELNRFVAEALKDGKTKKNNKFHGGEKPDLADLDTFGVLQAVRGHRVYDNIIRDTNLKQWLQDMDKVVGNPAYTSMPL